MCGRLRWLQTLDCLIGMKVAQLPCRAHRATWSSATGTLNTQTGTVFKGRFVCLPGWLQEPALIGVGNCNHPAKQTHLPTCQTGRPAQQTAHHTKPAIRTPSYSGPYPCQFGTLPEILNWQQSPPPHQVRPHLILGLPLPKHHQYCLGRSVGLLGWSQRPGRTLA
jgi:hypothetical protein